MLSTRSLHSIRKPGGWGKFPCCVLWILLAGISLESRAESFTERLGGLFKSVFYEAPPAAVQKEEPLSQGAQLPAGKEGSLLLVVRTDDQAIPEASSMTPREVMAAYGTSERTADNWKQYAKEAV